MSECYWWNSPFTLLKNNRFFRFFPQSWSDFGTAEAVNRWSIYAVYIAVGAYLITSSLRPLAYSAAFISGLYLYNTRFNRNAAPPCGLPATQTDNKTSTTRNNPNVPPPTNTRGAKEPSRNVATYDERLTEGLLARGSEIPARPPIEASKQRKIFARNMPMTGDEIPYRGIYEATHSDLRLRPVP